MSVPPPAPSKARKIFGLINLVVIAWLVGNLLAGHLSWPSWHSIIGTLIGVPLFLVVAWFAFVVATARRR